MYRIRASAIALGNGYASPVRMAIGRRVEGARLRTRASPMIVSPRLQESVVTVV